MQIMFPGWQILFIPKLKISRYNAKSLNTITIHWWNVGFFYERLKDTFTPNVLASLKENINFIQQYTEMQDIIVTHDKHLKFNSAMSWGTIKTLQKVCNYMQKIQTDLNNHHSEFVTVQLVFKNINNADIYIFP